jgi:hypothetical protein
MDYISYFQKMQGPFLEGQAAVVTGSPGASGGRRPYPGLFGGLGRRHLPRQ